MFGKERQLMPRDLLQYKQHGDRTEHWLEEKGKKKKSQHLYLGAGMGAGITMTTHPMYFRYK